MINGFSTFCLSDGVLIMARFTSPSHTHQASIATDRTPRTDQSIQGRLLSTIQRFLTELGSSLSIHNVSLFTFAVDGILILDNKIFLSEPSQAHFLNEYLSKYEPSWRHPTPIFHRRDGTSLLSQNEQHFYLRKRSEGPAAPVLWGLSIAIITRANRLACE